MPNVELVERELSHQIVGAFFKTYNVLGYGFIESVYANALAIELKKSGLRYQTEVPIEILYENQRVGWYRADILVERRVIIEVKSTQMLPSFAKRQVLNYLAATRLPLGLVLHFGPKAECHRVVRTRT
jgi:GxxExxY protein